MKAFPMTNEKRAVAINNATTIKLDETLRTIPFRSLASASQGTFPVSRLDITARKIANATAVANIREQYR